MTAIDAGVVVAIAVMAGATYSMRICGFWLMSHVPLTPRLRRMLEALPGTVVVATILPVVAREGLSAALAIAAAATVMLVLRNDFLAVLAGLAAASAARFAGL